MNSDIFSTITINSRLQWNHHIDHISVASNQMLTFLWRTMHKCPRYRKQRAYRTIAQPKVECCVSDMGPHHQEYIDNIEKVQWRARQFVPNTPHRHDTPVSVTNLIQDPNWKPPQGKGQHFSQASFYKLVGDIVDIPGNCQPEPHNLPTRGDRKKHKLHQTVVNAEKFSVLPIIYVYNEHSLLDPSPT